MASDDELKQLKERLEEQQKQIDALVAERREEQLWQEVEKSQDEALKEVQEIREKQQEIDLEKEQISEVEVDLENEQMPEAGINRDEEAKKNEIGNKREDMFSEALPTHSQQEVEAIDRQIASEMRDPARRADMYQNLGIEETRQELYDEQLNEAADSIEQTLERSQQQEQENENEQTR